MLWRMNPALPVHSTGQWLLPRPGIKMLWLLAWVGFWYAAGLVGSLAAALSTDGLATRVMWAGVLAAVVPLLVGLPIMAIRTDRHHKKIVPLITATFGVPVGLEDLYNLQRQDTVRVAQDPEFTLCRVAGPDESSSAANMVGIVGPWAWQPPSTAADLQRGPAR
jgi:hypothetical protein